MTSLIDNQIDMLIRRVRNRLEQADFVFMSAYPPRKQPNPVSKYIVTVENTEVKEAAIFVGGRVGEGKRGKLYEAAVVLRTYAPMKSAGSALLRASSLLADAIDLCDTERAVREIVLYSLCYDTAVRTSYRDIKARLRYLLCEEDDDD